MANVAVGKIASVSDVEPGVNLPNVVNKMERLSVNTDLDSISGKAEIKKQSRYDLRTRVQNLESNGILDSMETLSIDTTADDEAGEGTQSTKEARYELRKKTRKLRPEEFKRRCSLKPKKRSYSTMETDDEVKEYYLDKNVKRKHALETIYEEIEGTSENSIVISRKKLNRLIQFKVDAKTLAAKLKKRKAKMRTYFF